MRWLVSRRNGFWLLLITSLGFNAGFGTTFGVRTYQRYCRYGRSGDGSSWRRLHETMNLTPRQEDQMNAAKQRLLEQVDPLQQELNVETEALAELVTAPESDREAIAVRLDKVASLRREIQHRVVEHFLEVKELLSARQREAFDQMIRRSIFRHSRHGHRSRAGGHGFRGRSGHEAATTSDVGGGPQ